MALPIVIAAGAVLTAIYAAIPDSVKDITKEEMERASRGEMEDFTEAALTAAFEKIGLEIDLSEGLTPKTITEAINAGPLAGTGIELTNIFDKEACKRDVMRIGLARAAEAYGIEVKDVSSVEAIRDTIKSYVSQQLDEQLMAGAGEWLDVVPELASLAREIASAMKQGLVDESGNLVPPGLMMDEFHVNLRERQARYAATHSRAWVAK